MRRAATANGARRNRAASFKRLREAQGLTQQQLGARIGVSHAQIWRYEHGNDSPSLEVLDRLLEALECTYEDLRKSHENGRPRLLSIKPSHFGFYGRLVASKTVDADPQVKAACGLPPDAPPILAWDTWLAGVHADDLPRVKAELARLHDPNDGVFNLRYRLTGHDGVERCIIDYGRMIFEGPQPLRLQGMLFDVTHELNTRNTHDKIARILITVRQHLET